MELTLSEKILLIALDDEKGHLVNLGSNMQFGLAGAILMELAAQKKIDVREKTVHLTQPGPVSNSILNEAISLIRQSSKPRKLNYWIMKFSNRATKWKKMILKSLVYKHILVEKEKRFLGIIPYKRYPMVNPSYENEVKNRIRKITMQGSVANEEELMLIGLVHTCDLSSEIFQDKSERKIAKKKMKELSAHNPYSKVIDETQAAITAAIVVSIAASTAATAAH
ncbi:MAG: GPP34 family phosphoprotein [Bacteroidales bacterium]|nr:GPP34 family phosphoprotein [Bacteroidales bacterium]MCF8456794.1 GPP34 family phosphoprotein [Bacteroidales bacterium]